LIYVSAARRGLAEEEYTRILSTARTKNAANGITGLLLNIDQGFLQILEGPSAIVDETFARIARDNRHTSVRKIYDATAERRAFAGWSMGFHDLRGRTLQTEGAFPLSRAALIESLPEGLGQEVLIFVRTFFAVNAAAS
jgi:hypothetical protein